ncbi:MAG: hypothetical protein JXR97_02790 [Planctomycetes bacterium]|nr:hypothetical protein [Planctomycetota bacterium]
MNRQGGFTYFEKTFIVISGIIILLFLISVIELRPHNITRFEAQNLNNLKLIGNALEKYMSHELYGMAPPHIEGKDYSITVMEALTNTESCLIDDYKTFQNPYLIRRDGLREANTSDYRFSPILSPGSRPYAVIACDKPGIWEYGGALLFKDGQVRYPKVSAKEYADWVAAFERGDESAMRGPMEP